MESSGRFQREGSAGRTFQHQRNSCREVVVQVPKNAIGLIIGKGGRNIKELQRMEGIRYINVDTNNSAVKIVGTKEGIAAAQNRITKAICLAKNQTSYFPERTMTCLHLGSGIDKVRFKPISSYKKDHNFGGVRLEQLDTNRNYFVMDAVGNGGSLTTSTSDALRMNKGRIIVGYDENLYLPFLEEVIRSNAGAMSEPSAATGIVINFGKTFLSSVPEDAQEVSLYPEDVNSLEYGKEGIRPEFVRHFHPACRESLLASVLDDYVPMESGKYAVIHCISQKANKRHTIKMKYRSEDDAYEGRTATKVMRAISEAKTYFEVLGVDGNRTTTNRDIEIAHQRRMLEVHPDTSSHPQVGQARELLNEAWRALRDEDSRETYSKLPASLKVPRNRFVYCEDARKPEPLPEIYDFLNKDRKLGLLNVLVADSSRCEFRNTIEIQKEESLDPAMRRRLQQAWDEKSGDSFQFPGGTDDWLIIETIRYKQNEKYSNGLFTLSIDKTKEEHFGKVMDGINVSLKSVDVNYALDQLSSPNNSSEKQERNTQDLMKALTCLHNEAEKLSKIICQRQ